MHHNKRASAQAARTGPRLFLLTNPALIKHDCVNITINFAVVSLTQLARRQPYPQTVLHGSALVQSVHDTAMPASHCTICVAAPLLLQ